LAALLAVATWFSFQLSGLISEGRAWLERSLRVSGGSERIRLHAMNSIGFAAWTQGDTDRASEVAQFVINAWKPGYPLSTLGIAHFNAGLIAWQRGDFQTMAQQLMTAKPILHEGTDLNGEGFCNLALGVLARFSGDFAAARGLLDEALDLHTRAGHEWGAATSRYLAGEVAHDEGKISEAAELLADGLNRYLNQGDVYGSGACVAALAVFAAERNEMERAARLFGAAFGMSEHAGVVLPPVDLERYQQTAAMVATQVPESAFRSGRSWSFEEATQEALALAAEIAAGRVPGPIDDPLKHLLTPDQLDAVNLFCEGHSVHEIAERLFRDPNTIYDRLARARQRLGVTSNRQLVAKVGALRSNGSGSSVA
jgi:non-specific serine/threonine protein kinase